VAFYKTQYLSDLVWLGFPSDILKVHKLRYIWMGKDVVAATYPHFAEAKCLDKSQEISERNIPEVSLEEPGQKLPLVHGAPFIIALTRVIIQRPS
jgi:hypothetical protein